MVELGRSYFDADLVLGKQRRVLNATTQALTQFVRNNVTVRPTTSVFCARRRDAARHGKTERATRGDRTMAAIA